MLAIGWTPRAAGPVVRELVESPYTDCGYRSASATSSIGYPMPEPMWRTGW